MSKRPVMRTCVGCGLVRNQNELVRFARSLRGTVIEDVRHNLQKRGAYICADTKERCLIKAIAHRSFDRALPTHHKIEQ